MNTETIYTRRQYLLMKLVEAGTPLFAAVEAIHSTAIERPEWDLNEKRTWTEWEEEQ